MVHYLEKARYPYLDTGRRKHTSDLVLDGWSPLEVLRDKVLEKHRPAHLTRCTRPCRATLRLFSSSEARLLVLADVPRSGPLC